MTDLKFPKALNPLTPPTGGDARQLTLLGRNGAGKSRFMDELAALNAGRAYRLSAPEAFFPQSSESTLPGSVDAMYRVATAGAGFLRPDAVCELDKVVYLLYAGEIQRLITQKEASGKKAAKGLFDKVKRMWEGLFPGNRILLDATAIRFVTPSGDDPIPMQRLSHGEKAALYYLAGVALAPAEGLILIDSPTLFIHHPLSGRLWNGIESLRPDCSFIYDTSDEDFVATRTHNTTVLVHSFESDTHSWDYEFVAPGALDETLLAALAGRRRAMLFVEGDTTHSIDIRLYSLVFPDMDVRALGSCNKVIETVRSLNDQRAVHHLRCLGIVDRDRRTDKEVEYLRRKRVMVPEVAEIENIFLLPEVIKVMASLRGRDPERTLAKVSRYITREFSRRREEQALQHVRHRIKREVECKIDARFTCITAMELHIKGLLGRLQPRRHYNTLRQTFGYLADARDYTGILRVFNHKPMLGDCGLHKLLGYKSREDYVGGVLDTLKRDTHASNALRQAIRGSLKADADSLPTES